MSKQFFRSIFLFLFMFTAFSLTTNAQETPENMLARAVTENQYNQAQQALDAGADINKAASYTDNTPLLTIAVSNNYTEMVKLLLEHKADPNIYTENDTFPLLKAIENQNPEIVNLLLEAGANVNYETSQTTPPLIYSIEKFQAENGLVIFRSILNNNADINAKATDGTTALILAANNNTDNQEFMCTIARDLIKKGANRNLRDNNNKTALQYATDLNFTTMMNILRASNKSKVKTGLMIPVPVKIK